MAPGVYADAFRKLLRYVCGSQLNALGAAYAEMAPRLR
jgi:hypothetical protein